MRSVVGCAAWRRAVVTPDVLAFMEGVSDGHENGSSQRAGSAFAVLSQEGLEPGVMPINLGLLPGQQGTSFTGAAACLTSPPQNRGR